MASALDFTTLAPAGKEGMHPLTIFPEIGQCVSIMHSVMEDWQYPNPNQMYCCCLLHLLRGCDKGNINQSSRSISISCNDIVAL